MITLRKIVYDISELLNIESDDSRFSEDHIAYMVHNKRNALMKNYMAKLNKEFPKAAIQSLCMSLEQDDNCFDDQTVVKSILKLPSTLNNTGRSNIIRAYGKNMHFIKNMNIIDYVRLPYVKHGKFNSKQVYIAVDPDDYLIIYNTDDRHLLMEDIRIEGIFEDPEEAYNLSCEENEKDFWDTPYPLESALVDMLKTEVVKELTTKYKVPTDEINDGEDITTNGKA